MRVGLNLHWHKRVPVILQTESAECGLISLLMVMNHYGAQQDCRSIRSRHHLSSRGLNLASLNQIAVHEGFDTHAVSIELDELPALKLPCILHWDMTHFVVLVGRRRSQWVIHDPAIGRRTISQKQLSRHFTGIALQIQPGSDFTAVPTATPKIGIRPLFNRVSGLKGALLKLFCLSLVVELFSLLMPLGNQFIMDHVLPAQDHGLLTLICLAMLLMVITQTTISLLRAWLAMVTGMQIQLQWRRGLFAHLLRLPVLWFEKRKMGDIASRFGSLDTLRETFTTNVVQLILDLIMLVGASGMMLLYAPTLFAVVVAFTSLYTLIRLATYRYMRQITEEQIVHAARQHSHFMESLYCIGTIKSMNMQAQRANGWHQLSVNELNADIKNARFGLLYLTLETFLSAIDNIIVLWLGAQAVIGGTLSLGMLLAFVAYRSQFSSRASGIITALLEIKMTSLHRERISDVLLTTPEIAAPAPLVTARQADTGAALSCESLSFRYDGFSPPVLNNVSLQVPAGGSLAITGVSGCGKTTLLRILAGLIAPQQGKVRIDGCEVEQYGLARYRDRIACVLQDDRLLSGSIAENICGFSSEPDAARIAHCARAACIHEDIIALPMGYNTHLSELNGSLSGGQKQRVMIARALYRRPALLFLDESTSNLDEVNEARINQTIAALNITRVIVAHRQSTIDSADAVFHLDKWGDREE
ncbi:peptidase domain-containing ABC transporter [Pantoea sp. A4]|uniref:peptidase domain-containing ABC transporter n=1 Tax=Pantoea sp. A4 TaxID=1225184 RepID=UPI000370FCA6|nr:peptidase domain-containing ABC transporter [Pantoea sp. A4]